MQNDLITVYLTQDQAKMITELEKRYLFMKVLESVGVFKMGRGSVTINVDEFGQIGSVDIHHHYKV